MAHTQLSAVLRHIRKLAATPDDEPSDGQLLERFTVQRDEAAFAALVQRHGSMVLGVAQRVLHHAQDAEDVFQATFLILSRKASAIRSQESLGAWLHQVAHYVALRARTNAARRRRVEQREVAMPSDTCLDDVTWRELRSVLDEELAKLPDQQRQALVLCCLEGRRHEEAARQLGWTVATLRRRLSQGRELLRERLARRGLTLSAALVLTLAAESTAAAVAPAPLVSATLKAVVLLTNGAALTGTVSANVATLAEGGIHIMSAAKLKAVTALVLLMAGIAAAYGLASAPFAASGSADEKPQANAKQQAAKDDAIEVQGRVLDPDGKAVAGAKLYAPRSTKEGAEAEWIERGITDKDGRFQLHLSRKEAAPNQPMMLLAVAPGFGLDWAELPKDGKSAGVTLRLVKDQPIRGMLVTTEGKPVQNVAVHVLGIMAYEKFDEFIKAYQRGFRHADKGTGARRLNVPLTKVLQAPASDKDGRFEIKGLGAGRVVGLEVKGAALTQSTILVITRPDLDVDPINKAILQNLGARPDAGLPMLHAPSFEFVVEPMRIIEGRVREAGNGKPIVGARVETVGVTAVTDAEGRYRLAGMLKREQYTLFFSAPKEAPLIGRWERVPSPPALEPAKLDVELTRGVLVTGRVYDKATGKGVQSELHFSPLPENKRGAKEQNLALHASADSEGRFRMVTITGPGVLLAQIPGTRLKIEGVPIYPYKPAEFDAEDRKRIKMTDDLKPRRAFLVAGGGAEDLDLSNACKVLDLKEGSDPVSCDLILDPGKMLTVRVQDPDGKPLTGALAAGVSAQTLRTVPLRTADCPVYALDPEQPREMIFLHTARKLAALLTVRGDENEPVTVRLMPTASVTGRVLDPAGKPVAGADVYTRYTGLVGEQLTRSLSQRGQQPQTDKEGRFRLEGIVPGLKWRLGFLKGRQMLEPEVMKDIRALEAGKTLDLGDVRVKPRRP